MTLHSLTVVTIMGAGFAVAQEARQGIPIDHQLTIAKCGGCHQRDANGLMRRLSYIRTSPEVWEQAIKRMVRLNGLSLKPEEGREILKFLTTNNGLSPEEEKPIFWEAEHRLFRDQSDKIPADALQHTCNYCHTIGRVLSQRRTKEDYDKLITMHLGLFPGSENTLRPRRPGGRPAAAVPVVMSAPTGGNPAVVPPPPSTTTARSDGRYPADVAVEYLAKAQPLITPEWTSWKAVMRVPKLEGKWMLVGYQQGRGRVFGVVSIEPGATADEFVTKTEIEYANSGASVSRTGKGIVYSGYSWRGRSTAAKAEATPATPGLNPAQWREALMVSRDGNTMQGRWFWGGYEEFGIDAHLTRIATQPMVAGASVFSIQSPSTTEVRIYGANFPANVKPADFDLGTGIAVKRIVKNTPSMVTLEVQASANLPSGVRDISFNRATAERSIAIYDKVAYVKVVPDASMARLGGVVAPKQFAQFEAIAYAAGADGKPQTSDDVPVGPVQARWGLEEFVATPDDDDAQFVGSINDSGLFTPNIEGPNPARQKQANNFPTNNWGDIWITATYQPPGGSALKAQSYLVVTIPVYVKYDQPEVGQ